MKSNQILRVFAVFILFTACIYQAESRELTWLEAAKSTESLEKLEILKVTSDGNILCAGRFKGHFLDFELPSGMNGDTYSFYIFKFSPEGELLWHFTADGTEMTNSPFNMNSITFDDSYIYMAGNTTVTTDAGGNTLAPGGVIIALDQATGNVEWTYQPGGRCYNAYVQDENVRVFCGGWQNDIFTINNDEISPEGSRHMFLLIDLDKNAEVLNAKKVAEMRNLPGILHIDHKNNDRFVFSYSDSLFLGSSVYHNSNVFRIDADMSTGDMSYQLLTEGNISRLMVTPDGTYMGWSNLSDSITINEEIFYPLQGGNYSLIGKFDDDGNTEWIRQIQTDLGDVLTGKFWVTNDRGVLVSIKCPFGSVFLEDQPLNTENAILLFDAEGELQTVYEVEEARFSDMPVVVYEQYWYVSAELTPWDPTIFEDSIIDDNFYGFALAKISETEVGLFTQNNQANSHIIYPNPAMTEFYISGPDHSGVTIFDMQGRKVMQEKQITFGMPVSTANLLPGIYNVRVITEQSISHHNLIIRE